MLQYLEGGLVLAIMAGVVVLGMLDKLLLRNLYRRLTKQADNMRTTKNRFLNQLRQRYEASYRLNAGVHNSRVFLEKQLSQYKFLRFSLRGADVFSSQAAGLVVLLGIAASLAAYWYQSRFEIIVLHTCAGIMLGIASFLFDNLVNINGCREVLLLHLEDYFENSLLLQLQRDKPLEEDRVLLSETDQEISKEEQSQRDIEYLKKSLSQIAAGMESQPEEKPPKKKLTAEEEQVIKDIIKEYLY